MLSGWTAFACIVGVEIGADIVGLNIVALVIDLTQERIRHLLESLVVSSITKIV